MLIAPFAFLGSDYDERLASVSIPGVFPPVKIKVRVGDQEYDEIHVDGGVSTQVTIYPAQVDLKKLPHQSV